MPSSGHEGARQFFKLYVTACPDLHFDIEQILPAGDSHVVVRWRSTGTHHGPLADTPATHRTASNHGCTLMEMKSGKAARAWVFFDNAHLSGRSAFCRGADVRVCWRATHGRLSASVTTASEFHDRVRPMSGGDMDMRCWLKQAEVDKSKL